jgi:hypothetical protein
MFDRTIAKQCVGRGWSSLIDRVYDALPEDTAVIDVKEKFGGLRIYVDSAPKEFWDLLQNLEKESMTMCEVCGRAGSPRKTGWIKTLCDEHFAAVTQGVEIWRLFGETN